VDGFKIAVTNRISPLNVTACPADSPCGAVNAISVVPVSDATVPPAQITGVPPIAHWNSGPYAGCADVFDHSVNSVSTAKLVLSRTRFGNPTNVRVPVLSLRPICSGTCFALNFSAGIRFAPVIAGIMPKLDSRAQ